MGKAFANILPILELAAMSLILSCMKILPEFHSKRLRREDLEVVHPVPLLRY